MNYSSTAIKKNLKVIILIISAVVVLVFILTLLSSLKFHIVSTDPNTSEVSGAIPEFNINFNKPLKAGTVVISSSPNIVSGYSINNKTLDINLSQLTNGDSYKIEIVSIGSTSNQVIKNDIIRFTAKDISINKLPKDQQKEILSHQDHYATPIDNPLVGHLPYSTLNYSLNASIVSSRLVIEATLYINEAQSADQSAVVAQDEQSIDSYIESFNLNPNNYTINYTIENL